jgi:hydrogenase-4 component B
MVMWETDGAVVVLPGHRQPPHPEIRRAGYLYLLIAHIGAHRDPAVLRRAAGQHRRLHLRQHARAELTPFWASVAFLLALFGFGAKAGILPLHVWLPEAHPAAPSPVSALMSGVMLKTAIYGLLRVGFDLLPDAAVVVGRAGAGVGLATALFGVVFARCRPT